jgi:UDP-N-acetylmuramate: L-alanyl-gamma-D-glutamyl-meso-diaminopimelate ligase
MKVHLIGICGTGMGSLAGLLKAAGHDVRGSDDKVYPPMSDQLRALAVPVLSGFRAENLDWGPERVVVGNVCTKDHVEVVEAQRRGLELTSFPALLAELFLADRRSLVVAGTHGKTTTSSLLAQVLHAAGREPGFLLGGVPCNFGQGWRLGLPDSDFVIEGDEYDTAFFDKGSKFFHYRPEIAILTSVELDHVDIFDSLDAVRAAFVRFVGLLPESGHLVVSASSELTLGVAKAARCSVATYALSHRAVAGVTPTWQATLVSSKRASRTVFEVTRHGETFGHFDMALAGEHNVENALAVIAVGASVGLDYAQLARGIARFSGVKRRQELRGIASGVVVIDDYAHHPTAVRETLAALRRRYDRGKLVALYEPRSATSRRSTFQAEFAEAFASADEVVVTSLYAADAIPPEQRFDPERLVTHLRGQGTVAKTIAKVDDIVEHVAERVHPGDCVVVFSSGSFGGIHEKLLHRLGDTIVPARREDMARVREILTLTGLGAGDFADTRAGEVLLCVDETGIVGCVAVEVHDQAAILRSLAVIPERRGRGLGWMLADNAVARARAEGADRLYLLTEHASDFFAEKVGFRAIERSAVEPSVAVTTHFRESAKSAIVMRLDL